MGKKTITRKIRQYLRNEKINIEQCKETGEIKLNFLHDVTMFFSKDCTWDNVKLRINNAINSEPNEDCSICMTKYMLNRYVACNKCGNNYCVNCYIAIFKANKGLIVCPFCRKMYGIELSEDEIELGVQNIKHKILSRWIP